MNSDIKTAVILGGLVIAIVVGISLSLSILESQVESPNGENSRIEKNSSEIRFDKLGLKKAPELVGISDYINSLPEELKMKIDDSVVLYDIWTYSCINCIRTLPFITAWDEKYSDQGLLIIGIHSPEFEFEKDVENVKQAVTKYGINYPVVLDNEKETWSAFENNYWPRKYIADHEGYIRYDHIGEGGYDETEKVIQELLKERAESKGTNLSEFGELVQIQEFEHSWLRTPELYFGYNFASGRNQLGSSEGFAPNQNVSYLVPEKFVLHNFYIEGTWTNLQDGMKLVSDSGRIFLPFIAKEVNIVTAGEADLEIFLDGKIITEEFLGDDVGTEGLLHTHHPDLYNVVNADESSQHFLEILIKDPGFEIFTFTFG
ncbi:MAG TPA: redoxin family protein [Nitrosopumilaceae archaeon]|nr:redoxin family protein [Nitrosopumilaceae archaeon]